MELTDGTTGLLIGLWNARAGGLQQYVSDLEYGETGHGYVVDSTGHIVAGPSVAALGDLLPLAGIRERLGEDEGGAASWTPPIRVSGWSPPTHKPGPPAGRP